MNKLPECERPSVSLLACRRAQHATPQPKRSADCPRSRGVYMPRQGTRACRHGSSPLARGLHVHGPDAVAGVRIIPARAGFTPAASPPGGGPSDHPRSRGVYVSYFFSGTLVHGSSPLARGLRWGCYRRARKPGIIPARAGFTQDVNPAPTSMTGSFPLARGLRDSPHEIGQCRRIIPARAGFTSRRSGRSRPAQDHPRSRGVYLGVYCRPSVIWGSSPLARGLHFRVLSGLNLDRIIPARAGFTPDACSHHGGRGDHPRSRGVYTCGSLESQRRATLPDRVHLHCRPSARSAEFR